MATGRSGRNVGFSTPGSRRQKSAQVDNYVRLYFELVESGVREFVGESGATHELDIYRMETELRRDAFDSRDSSWWQQELRDFERYAARSESDAATPLLAGTL